MATTVELIAQANGAVNDAVTKMQALVTALSTDPAEATKYSNAQTILTQLQAIANGTASGSELAMSAQRDLAAITPAPTPVLPTGQTTQTYVSAPATMALMAVSAIVGAAGGYAGKSYLDKQKGAREVSATEGRRKPRKQLREAAES
jgi:hypothetical protein